MKFKLFSKALYSSDVVEEVKQVSNDEYDSIAEEQNTSLFEDLNNESIEKDANTVDIEINTINKDSNSLEYGTKVTLMDEARSLNDTIVDFNFGSHYQKMPHESFQINFGSDYLPRFSCANHKLNIAVRGARLENLTRWFSAYLMLLSVKKEYDRNMFNDENPCSVDLETIEIYLQILKPVYILSQQFQFNHSTIADVIPSIKQLIHTYLQMDLPDSKRSLCTFLITALREKFYYELNSDVYKVIVYLI